MKGSTAADRRRGETCDGPTGEGLGCGFKAIVLLAVPVAIFVVVVTATNIWPALQGAPEVLTLGAVILTTEALLCRRHLRHAGVARPGAGLAIVMCGVLIATTAVSIALVHAVFSLSGSGA